jgi:hypothetical protein
VQQYVIDVQDDHWTLKEAAQRIGTDETGIYDLFIDGRLKPSVYFINPVPALRTRKTSCAELLDDRGNLKWGEAEKIYELNGVWDLRLYDDTRLYGANLFIIKSRHEALKYGVTKMPRQTYGIFVQRGGDILRLHAFSGKNDGEISPLEDLPSDAVLVVRKSEMETYKGRVAAEQSPSNEPSAKEIRRPAKLFANGPSVPPGEGFSEEALKLTTLSKYLGRETWTPVEAALLVCGIQPLEDCTQIPNGGMGLDNVFVTGSEDRFHEARRVLKLWNSRAHSPSKVRPAVFITWCKTYDNDLLNRINTDWLSEIADDTPGDAAQGDHLMPLDMAANYLAYKIWPDTTPEETATAVLKSFDAKAGSFTPVYALRSLAESRIQKKIDSLVLAGKIVLYDPVEYTPTKDATHALLREKQLIELLMSGSHLDNELALRPSETVTVPPVSQPPAGRETTTHKIKARASVLDAEIQAAKNRALDNTDPKSVWAELAKMAEEKVGCMLGLDEKDIKYQSGDEVKFFKIRSLRERMKRATTH